MALAVRDSLLDVCAGDITSIWFTGSAQERWDSPLDSVPELRTSTSGADAASLVTVADARMLATEPSPFVDVAVSGWSDSAAGRNAFAQAIRTLEAGAVIGARLGG